MYEKCTKKCTTSVFAIDLSTYSDDLVCHTTIDENGNWKDEKDLRVDLN